MSTSVTSHSLYKCTVLVFWLITVFWLVSVFWLVFVFCLVFVFHPGCFSQFFNRFPLSYRSFSFTCFPYLILVFFSICSFRFFLYFSFFSFFLPLFCYSSLLIFFPSVIQYLSLSPPLLFPVSFPASSVPSPCLFPSLSLPSPCLFSTLSMSLPLSVGLTGTTSKIIFPKRKVEITAIERQANEEVQKSMNHKLNFKKNPHNDPATVQNVLVKHTQKKAFSSSHNAQTHSTQNHGNYTNTVVTNQIPLFVADPETVEFNEYAIGDVMKVSLSFLNISTISRTLRVVPPGSGRFGMSPLIFPSGNQVQLLTIPVMGTNVILFYAKKKFPLHLSNQVPQLITPITPHPSPRLQVA